MAKTLETKRGDLRRTGNSPVDGTRAPFAATGTTPTLALPASHWSKRAEEARTLAERSVSPAIKRSWLAVSRNYEALARHAEALGAKPGANYARRQK